MDTKYIIKCEDLVYEYARNQQGNSGGKNQPKEQTAVDVVRALDGVSFEVEKGDFVAVIGRNGSGKTTLAKCLNALYRPVSGNVFINGWNTRDDEFLWNIRQTCGMVFQNPDNQLVSSIVEDDVAFGPENLGLPSELIRKRVDDALASVGMKEAAKRAPHMLSGGQKQRIAIAGVIAMKPQCVVFDEPTAMLDPKGRKEVMEIMEKLHDEEITIVLITHFMDEAIKADKIIVMDEGKITREGTPQEIFTDKSLMDSFKADLPCGVQLAMKLREKGIDIPVDIITEEQLADHLLSLKTGSAASQAGAASEAAPDADVNAEGR